MTPARLRILLAAVSLAFVPISPAGAQLGIESLLKNVTDIGIFGGYVTFLPRDTEIDAVGNNYSILGFELSFAVGALSCDAKMVSRGNGPPQTRHRYLMRSDSVRRCIESRLTLNGKTPTSNAGLSAGDTSKSLLHVKPARDTSWLFEFALGYSQISGFRSKDPKLELRGSVREAPMISVYATHEHPIPWTPLSFYLGLRSGLLQLQNVRIYMDTAVASGGNATSSVVYTGAAGAFLAGVAAGFVADIGPTSWFVEGAYSWRNFPSVEWTGPAKLLPKNLPQRLNVSGLNLTVGIQIPINASKGTTDSTGVSARPKQGSG